MSVGICWVCSNMAGENASERRFPIGLDNRSVVADQEPQRSVNDGAVTKMIGDVNQSRLIHSLIPTLDPISFGSLPDLSVDRISQTDTTENRDESQAQADRQLEAVKAKLDSATSITSRKSTDKKPGDKEADIIVRKDGTIELNPRAQASGGALTIEFDVDTTAREMAAAQKGVVRDMISYLKMRNPGAAIPDEWKAILSEALPPPVLRPRVTGGGGGGGGGGGFTGGLRGGDGGGFYGAGGDASPGSIIPQGLDGNYRPAPGIQTDSGGKLIDSLELNRFVDRVVAAVSGNEGNFTAINPNDAGYGISIGIRQWNQKAGELPTLLKAWHDADPAKFQQIFGDYSNKLLNEGWVRNANMSGDGNLMGKIKTALGDKEFQQVQVDLARNFVKDSIELGTKYGLRSELGLALVADIVNQKGRGGAEQALRNAGLRAGGTVANEQAAVERLSAVSHRPHAGQRFASLKNHFNSTTKADVNLA